jgi:hypothetical protein
LEARGFGNEQRDFVIRHRQTGFGMQHNQGRRAGIFTGIMMVKMQSQYLFQIGETMPAIAFQLGPGPSGNPDSVAPV